MVRPGTMRTEFKINQSQWADRGGGEERWEFGR